MADYIWVKQCRFVIEAMMPVRACVRACAQQKHMSAMCVQAHRRL